MAAEGLDPNQIVRWRDGPKYFGFKLTQQKKKIEDGEIPRPMKLSDSGRAMGWLGRVIIEHQQERLAAAAVKDRPAKT